MLHREERGRAKGPRLSAELPLLTAAAGRGRRRSRGRTPQPCRRPPRPHHRRPAPPLPALAEVLTGPRSLCPARTRLPGRIPARPTVGHGLQAHSPPPRPSPPVPSAHRHTLCCFLPGLCYQAQVRAGNRRWAMSRPSQCKARVLRRRNQPLPPPPPVPSAASEHVRARRRGALPVSMSRPPARTWALGERRLRRRRAGRSGGIAGRAAPIA